MSDQPKLTIAEALARQVAHAPTHVFDDDNDGVLTKIDARPALPSAAMVALIEVKMPHLETNIAWEESKGNQAIRMQFTTSMGGNLANAMRAQVFEVLPISTKAWLMAWQEFINDGSVWGTAQYVTDYASMLINTHLLLCSKVPTRNWWGKLMHTRTTVESGTPGSIEYVEGWMGSLYVKWLAAV